MENNNVLVIYNNYINSVEDTVGYESLSDVINKIAYGVDLLAAKGLNAVINIFKTNTIMLENITKYKTKQPNIKQLFKENKELTNLIRDNKLNIATAFNRYAPVILGLKVTLPEVSDFLLKHSKDVSNIYKILNDFSHTVDTLLTANPDDFKRLLPTKADISDIVKDTNSIKKDLSKLFDSKLMTDRKKIKELIKNPKQLTNTINTTLKLGEIYRYEETDKLVKLYKNIIDNLNVLISTIDKNKDNLRDDVRNKLSSYILALAEYLTSVSFVIYIHVSLVDMLNAIIKILKADTKEAKNITNKLSKNMTDLNKNIQIGN